MVSYPNRHKYRTVGCRIHCVIFIVSATEAIADVPENIQIKQLLQKLRQTRIPVVLVLTKVDILCEEVGKDVTKMFRSKKIQEVIKTASEMFEVEKDLIYPVVNCVNVSEKRTEINIPLLLALRQSLYLASKYLEYLGIKRDDDDVSLKEMRDNKLTTDSISSAIKRVGKMLDENMLPEYEDIQTIHKLCGRQSENMKTLCGKICRVINRKVYEDAATDIWPAWDPAKDKIVFVVELTTITNSRSTSLYTDLEIKEYKRNCSAFEKEGHLAMVKEEEFLANKIYDDTGRFQNLRKEISTYSKELMDKHRNINAIFPSIVKSVGYLNSGKHRLIETLCISIRVEKKVSGLIPLAEKPIATYLGTFPTDVIAGDFCFLGDGPNDFHENIKIGSAIHAGLVTDKGDLLGGTIGCFVKHKQFGLCGITSAHIILSPAEIQEVLKDGYLEYDKNSLKPVYQPISDTSPQFGQVVAAACNEGLSDTPGVEVALIKILCRQPTSGSFPLTDSKIRPTFVFDSGNIADATLVRPLTEVFKFGIETGPTFGLLGIPGVSVRYRGGLRLENQLLVMPKKDAVFAKNGDSGSPAFIGVSCPGTEAAIGLVSGGFDSGQVLVTPIHAALKAVQCPPYLHRFEDVGGDSGINADISQGSESMDCS
ncbi:uncharacterized protein LOC132745884 [Ruditapes philippinarum]|uniref:uncharacterized protein LOC132745884 n=1 Tax=Ruditapes philippinarum TaxID=129788 RepID=UPI00295B50DA|nr:uncharacterized protein LOC132745884 [Ruditapes philippinarum]